MEEQVQAFRQRQQTDAKRFKDGLRTAPPGRQIEPIPGRKNLVERGWRDSEGERLEDFGVDEDIEFDEDDLPLSELLTKRRGHSGTSGE